MVCLAAVSALSQSPPAETPASEGSEPTTSATSYDVVVEGAPNSDITDALEKTLYLYRYQENGAPSIPLLRRRAESDEELAARILRSFGYYEPTVTTKVEANADDPTKATATLIIEPGPAFTLARHSIIIADPDNIGPTAPTATPKDQGSPVGETALAEPILAAETGVVGAWQKAGHPYAERAGRDAVADLEADTIEVDTTVKIGPYLVFGDLSFEGIPDVDEEYLRTYVTWEEGEPVDVAKLATFQQQLIGTRLFDAGSVSIPDEPPEGEAAPVKAVLEQRPFRTISAGVRYSTDEGPGANAEIEHRNLFGANEIGSLSADASFTEQRIDSAYRKPQYLRNGQDLVAGLALRHIEDEAYTETGATFTLGLERQIWPELKVGLGGLAELTETEASDGGGTSILFGIPAFAQYDTTDDLLNPTEGFRIRVSVTPFGGTFDGTFVSFLSTDATASTYYDLSDDGAYVLAGRVRLGSILAADVSDVPSGRRLFSGGGGSVRGYNERFIGPLDADNEPTGGLSVAEAGIELRARVYGDFGVALFAEAGSVAEEVAPTFGDGLQLAAGIGLRYYSPLGPIRADVGIPLNPRDADDRFQVYFSIGQAF